MPFGLTISVNAAEDVGDLECPRCRRPAEGEERRNGADCPSCGMRLVRSVRQSEADAWRQLYGGTPARFRR